MNRYARFLLLTSALSGCSMSPAWKLPEISLPVSYKEQPPQAEVVAKSDNWQDAVPMEKTDRGQWWKIFGDATLNDLEAKAAAANPSLQAAAARVEQARGVAQANVPSLLPDIDIGANATHAKPASASLAAFGGAPGVQLKPYTLYSAQGVASYEADLFGRVRDNYHAYEKDADAADAAYRSMLLALQADVAQQYFLLRSLDAERQLLRDTVSIREEAARIMQRRFELGEAGQQDQSRTQSELASVKSDLLALDRQRAIAEHALSVLLGKMPSEFMFAEASLVGMPPEIPAGLPSALLQRRPDVAAAQYAMAAANLRIGVARTAFFPRLLLTASGGFESTALADLFNWPSRTWALGQLAGSALSMPIFDSGRNQARLDVAKASYDEALANYRQQLLVAFKDVEDNLASQHLLSQQQEQQDLAASSTARTTDLTQKRYHEGDADFFEVVNAERDSLGAGRAAVQLRGQRFITTVALIRALGGGWDEAAPAQVPLSNSFN